LTKELKIYNGEKAASSTKTAGKTGCVVTCIVHPTCKSPTTLSEEAAHFLKLRLLSILEMFSGSHS
jgi:hypothetical protein